MRAHRWLAGAVIVLGVGAAPAVAATARPTALRPSLPSLAAPAGASDGTATLSMLCDVSTGVQSDTLVLTGALAANDWHYVGHLTGSAPHSYAATPGNCPDLSTLTSEDSPNIPVTSADGSVTGDCGVLASTFANTGYTNVGPQPAQFAIDCLLSHNGSPPWPMFLNGLVNQRSASNGGVRWTARYVGADPHPAGSLPTTPLGSFGAVALTYGWDNGTGEVEWGPIDFSGQVTIGGVAYDGELAGPGTGWYKPSSTSAPPLQVNGASAGHQVTGSCTPQLADPAPNVSLLLANMSDVSAATYACSLSIDGGAAAAVTLYGEFEYQGMRGDGGYSQNFADGTGSYLGT